MEAYKSIESIYLLNDIDQMVMTLNQAICKQGGVTIQREWDRVIKDGKAYCGQSAVSRVIIYDICTAPQPNLGPRKPKWVIGHNSTHATLIIIHFFGSAWNCNALH